MGFWHASRIPAGELIEGEEEVEASADAATRRRLEADEDLFVSRALRLGVERGTVLDVGTGAGLIPVKLALRNPELIIHALDLSVSALRRAALNAAEWGVGLRIILDHGDATAMPFDDGLFDLVVCRRVLHRVADPVALLREIGRVCRGSGAVLLGDLRRPSRAAFGCFMRRTGRHYRGSMRRMYESSVRSSYTMAELRELSVAARVESLRVVRLGYSGIGLERHARPVP